MGIKEDRAYLKKRKAEREKIDKATAENKKAEFNKAIIDREEMKKAYIDAKNKYYDYKANVKRALLGEALKNIYFESFNNINSREKALCENLLDQYITENTVDRLLKNMKFSTNSLLRTINEKTEEYFKKITEDANSDDPSSQVIKSEDIASFWNDIDKSEDIEDITNLIRLRVSNAEEDFVNKNLEDKEDVKTVLKQTASRIQNAKNTNDNEYAENVEESETRLAKNKIYSIQHEGRRTVFDRMVRNLSEAVILNEDAKEEFTLSNGRLDMIKIVESARCMYTLLEMVSSIQLEKVDEAYIEDTLRSIK